MKVAIIGSGAWGTALGQVLVDNDHEVIIYGVEEKEVNDINLGLNTKYFDDYKLDLRLKATLSMQEALTNSDYVLLAVPSKMVRIASSMINKHLDHKVSVINVAKGLDEDSKELLSDAIKQEIDKSKLNGVVTLIGPSFAIEVIRRIQTTICAVSKNKKIAKEVQSLFSNKYFRVYTLEDEIGAQYGASLKNIMALASGMISGLNLGENTKASLITRGLLEMSRYGIRMSAKKETFMGLTGLGDLVLTCSTEKSRNFSAGKIIGLNDGIKDFMETNTKTVEGIRTCKLAYLEAKKLKIDVPIIEAVYKILFEDKKPSETIDELMLRSLKEE